MYNETGAGNSPSILAWVTGISAEETMKLQVIFILIDIAILLAYPFVFVAGKVRHILKIKR